MIEKVSAGLVVAVCGLLLLRLALGASRRTRLDALVRKVWQSTCARVRGLWNWRRSRRLARQVADEAIRRARTGVERDGNVYKPRSFRGPDEPE